MSKALLKRRSLLKRLGASAFLAVPVFRESLSQAADPPLRLVLLNLPGGIPFFKDSEEQLDTYFDSMLKPFSALQQDAIVFDRINNGAGDLVATYFELEGHGGGCRSMFGGAVMDQGCGGTQSCGDESNAYRYGKATTIDQVLAKAKGGATRFDALHFGTLWDKGQGGDHAECFFNNGQPVRPMSDPAQAMTRLFGSGTPQATPVAMTPTAPDPNVAKAYARGKSRLDFLKAEIGEIKALVGTSEQARLDQHLTAFRELEGKLPNPDAKSGGGGGSVPGSSCAAPALGAAGDIRATSSAFNELAYQALNCDLTRIVALQWLSSGDHLPRFEWMGLKLDHHTMEHSLNGDEYIKAQTWIFEQMAAFITKLKNTSEGGGSMLDNTIVYLASEMGNGTHILSPALSVLFGKAGGKFKTGRRVDAGNRNINDVLLSIVNAMGVQATSVGDPMFNKGPIALG